jgi:hypothetical protein
MFSPRPRDLLGIRRFEFRLHFEYLMDMEWERETQQTDFTVLGVNFHSGDEANFELTHLRERLEYDFDIHEGVTIPVGDYETLGWRASVRTASNRIVSGRVEVSGGEFWSGNRSAYEFWGTVRPASGVSFSTRYEHNGVKLPEGDFSTNLMNLDLNLQMSPWTSFTSNLQYDDVSKIVGLFARFRWIIRPGSDLFLVYTHNWLNMDGGLLDRFSLTTISRGATTKVNYTHRF